MYPREKYRKCMDRLCLQKKFNVVHFFFINNKITKSINAKKKVVDYKYKIAPS